MFPKPLAAALSSLFLIPACQRTDSSARIFDERAEPSLQDLCASWQSDSAVGVTLAMLSEIAGVSDCLSIWPALEFDDALTLGTPTDWASLAPLIPLRNLTRITLLDGSFTDFGALAQLPQLTQLTIRESRFSHPEELNQIQNLESLSVSGRSWGELEQVTLPQLKSLSLTYGAGQWFPIPKNIEVLSLTNNEISQFALADFPQLISADLSFNPLQELDASELPRLEKLSLGATQVSQSTLKLPPHLKSLDISKTLVTDLRPISHPVVEVLQASQLSLTRAHLEGFPKLQELSLTGAHLTLSDMPGLLNLPGLRRLEIGGNSISDLRFLENFPGLETLTCDNAKVENVAVLSSLWGLRRVSLRNNRIRDITPLADHPFLQQLYLDNNEITSLAAATTLVSLSTLSAEANPIVLDDVHCPTDSPIAPLTETCISLRGGY